MELLAEIVALGFTIIGFLITIVKLTAKFSGEISKMATQISDLTKHSVEQDSKVVSLEVAKADMEKQIAEMGVRDNYQQETMTELKGEIKSIHKRISDSERRIIERIDNIKK